MVNGTITLAVPAGWSGPSRTATAPGYVTASAGTVTVASRTIAVSAVTKTGGQTLKVTYGARTGGGPGAVAPSTTGTQVWAAKQRSTATGVLSSLATSPSLGVS
jgi:hypothetical protein